MSTNPTPPPPPKKTGYLAICLQSGSKKQIRFNFQVNPDALSCLPNVLQWNKKDRMNTWGMLPRTKERYSWGISALCDTTKGTGRKAQAFCKLERGKEVKALKGLQIPSKCALEIPFDYSTCVRMNVCVPMQCIHILVTQLKLTPQREVMEKGKRDSGGPSGPYMSSTYFTPTSNWQPVFFHIAPHPKQTALAWTAS